MTICHALHYQRVRDKKSPPTVILSGDKRVSKNVVQIWTTLFDIARRACGRLRFEHHEVLNKGRITPGLHSRRLGGHEGTEDTPRSLIARGTGILLGGIVSKTEGNHPDGDEVFILSEPRQGDVHAETALTLRNYNISEPSTSEGLPAILVGRDSDETDANQPHVSQADVRSVQGDSRGGISQLKLAELHAGSFSTTAKHHIGGINSGLIGTGVRVIVALRTAQDVLSEERAVGQLAAQAEADQHVARADLREGCREAHLAPLQALRGGLGIEDYGLVRTHDGLTIGTFGEHDVARLARNGADKTNGFCHNLGNLEDEARHIHDTPDGGGR